MNIDQIIDDITHLSDIGISQMVPPYEDQMEDDQKLNATYSALRRSTALKSRTLTLINAYYLGKLIALADKTNAAKYKKRLTAHYLKMAQRLSTYSSSILCRY